MFNTLLLKTDFKYKHILINYIMRMKVVDIYDTLLKF